MGLRGACCASLRTRHQTPTLFSDLAPWATEFCKTCPHSPFQGSLRRNRIFVPCCRQTSWGWEPFFLPASFLGSLAQSLWIQAGTGWHCSSRWVDCKAMSSSSEWRHVYFKKTFASRNRCAPARSGASSSGPPCPASPSTRQSRFWCEESFVLGSGACQWRWPPRSQWKVAYSAPHYCARASSVWFSAAHFAARSWFQSQAAPHCQCDCLEPSG